MKNIITFFAKNGLWVNALIFIVFLVGIVSTVLIKRSFFPEQKPIEIQIDAYLEQASTAEEVELRLTNKIEHVLKKVAGIDNFKSTSSESKSSIRVKLSSDKYIKDKRQEIQSLLSKERLPANKITVAIHKKLEPVISVVLFGSISQDQIRSLSGKIENDFYDSGLIKSVSVYGKPYKELRIEVSRENLLKYNLTIKDISNRIKGVNSNVSSGTLYSDENVYHLKSWTKSEDIEEIKNIPINVNPKGSIVVLKDIAKVYSYFREVESFYNNEKSVTLSIRKTAEEDIIAITDWIYDYVEKFNTNHESAKLDVINDQSIQVRGGINILSKNGLTGLILVVVVLGIFLNFKTSVWVAFGIPLSFFGMMIFLNLMEYTINQISMFGMIVVVGILVDDGIVIGENICYHLEKGKRGLQAAIDGTLEMLPSVFSSVATTVVAFAALLFIEGNVGKLVAQLAFVVMVSLGFSLIEASLILPNHLKSLEIKDEANWKVWLHNQIEFFKNQVYGSFLSYLIKLRWVWAFTSLALIGGLFLLLKENKKIEFSRFPHLEANSIELSIQLKKGVSKEKTQNTLQHLSKEINVLSKELVVDKEKVILSNSTFLGKSEMGKGYNHAMISVQLNSKALMSNAAVIKQIRQRIGLIGEVEKYSIGTENFFGKPLSIYLTSNNSEELIAFKKELLETLAGFSELEDINTDESSGNNVLNIKLKEKAYLLGVSKFQIVEQIKDQMNGRIVQVLKDELGEIPLTVITNRESRNEWFDLESMMIKSRERMIPLSELATITKDKKPTVIRHFNGQRQIRIEANQRNAEEPISELMTKIEGEVLPKINKKYPSVYVSKGGQQREDEKFNSSALITAVILVPIIVLMIALSLKSVAQSLLILFMLIPSVLGSLIGHAFEHTVVVSMSYVGFISLVGIVVNDVIVFADRYNNLLKEGLPFLEAVVEAGKSRFRAILLTSITTIVGLYPLVLEKSIHANFLRPMAISVSYGVLFGTVFILILFPLLLAMTNDFRKLWYRILALFEYVFNWLWNGNKAIRNKYKPTSEEVEPAIRRGE